MFVRRKKYNELIETTENLLNELTKLKKRSFLMSIERKGRVNMFVFIRDNEIHKIETMGMMSDDVTKWRENLIE